MLSCMEVRFGVATPLENPGGCQQEDEGPFWCVRCNIKLKPRILNLLGFFDILTQIILDSVKKMKCGKLNHISEYINFMY